MHIIKTLLAPPYRPPPHAYRAEYLALVRQVRALYAAALAAECALAHKLPAVVVQLEAYLDAAHGAWNPERYGVDRWGAMRTTFVWEMAEGGLGPAAVPRLAAETHSCGPEYEVLALSAEVDYDVVRDTMRGAGLAG
ncbi:hypothetical protein NpPPO83_00008175 [Neofusicoccum parvum]|uniref:Uncharacterized protein n=1 Tax=Neofusicoccum parvum TaxID=310453 RepID=A0ACB5RSW6_9PEZI|nr:hypothetical protein NpPPO83_00008175 [Neofusicoccum parvum]